MNLNSLFKKQKQLDEYIVKEKELEGVDLLPRKTVALICELYECINEARFFKYWSENQKPNIEEHEIDEVDGNIVQIVRTPLLEEYIDTIHFTLSIANDLGVHEHKYVKTQPQDLNDLVLGITNLATIIPISKEKHQVESLINNIITLGYQLGFDEKAVIEAYHEKNKENYARQKVGY